MSKASLSAQEIEGIWAIGIGLFLIFGISIWNNLPEGYKITAITLLILGGLVEIITSRLKKHRKKVKLFYYFNLGVRMPGIVHH